MNIKEKYGDTALIAGASEGIGAAFAHELASRGMNLVLIARREDELKRFAAQIQTQYGVTVLPIICDLANDNALNQIQNELGNLEVSVLICNAAFSPIGPFLKLSDEDLMKAISVNMIAPAKLTRAFGERMVKRGKGAVVLLSSLAGLQGSAYLAMYSASKAFNRTFAEALWYEWKNKGVDVIACIAGATATPGYLNSKPKSVGMFAPRVLEPNEVVQECLSKLGTVPSFITGNANRFASFFMTKLFSRRQAVTIMGDTLKRIYSVED